MPHPLTVAPSDSENSNQTSQNNSPNRIASTSSTLLQIWFEQNIYPVVTLKRILCFTLSQVSFFLAYGFFCQTKFYKSHIYNGDEDHDHDRDHNQSVLHQARPLVFLAAAFGVHTICLIFLFFFSFCSLALEKYRYHYLLKSLGECLVKILVVLLIMKIGDDDRSIGPHGTNNVEYSKVAGLATWCLLTVDSLCIIGLLNHAHHHSLFEATVTLTLHLGLARDNYYCRIPAAVFVFVIVVIKNFILRHTHHQQAPTNSESPCPVAWVAPEVV